MMENDNAYAQEIERWHAARIARLTASDGWLSLVGLEWLQPGTNRIGSTADNDIVLARARAHLGTITWAEGGTPSIALAADSGATIDGEKKTGAVLLDDSHAAPTAITFGSVNFIAIDRDGRKGLRVRDSEAETRMQFAGVECFPVDPAWRVVADWQSLDPRSSWRPVP